MNIEAHELMSPGGTCSPVLKLIPAQPLVAFTGVPPEADQRLIGDFSVAALSAMIEIHTVRDTISFTEEPVVSNGTMMLRQVLRAVVSRPTFDRLNALQNITKNHYLVFFTNKLGEQKMVGRRNSGASIRYTTDNKTEMLERNECIIEILSTQPRPAPKVQNPI